MVSTHIMGWCIGGTAYAPYAMSMYLTTHVHPLYRALGDASCSTGIPGAWCTKMYGQRGGLLNPAPRGYLPSGGRPGR